MYSCMGTQWNRNPLDGPSFATGVERYPLSVYSLLCFKGWDVLDHYTLPLHRGAMVLQGRLMHPKGAVLQTATFKTPTTLSFPTAGSLFHKPELL